MRYPKEHKEETKQKIVEAASRLFRERGISSVSVPEVMEEVGLTHGGFYAYFANKEELLMLALRQARVGKKEAMREIREQYGEDERLRAYSRKYLSTEHRDHPETGCLFATLASELARESGDVRKQLSEGFAEVVDAVKSILPPGTKNPEEAAIAQMCLHLGAMLVSRVLRSSRKSIEVLEVARKYSEALEEIGQKPPKAGRPERPPQAEGLPHD